MISLRPPTAPEAMAQIKRPKFSTKSVLPVDLKRYNRNCNGVLDRNRCSGKDASRLSDDPCGKRPIMEAFVDPYASDPWCLCPKATQRLNALERAIYSTVAYRDVFDFAPSIGDIHRYLHTIRCDRDDVLKTIRNGPLLTQHLATDGIYYALKGRTELFAVRLKRQALVERFWPLALKYGRYLANLPHSRMVSITGSFAAKNVREDCDIDFMLLTDAGAMWRTRALAMTSALFNRKFGNKKFCPNVFVSVAALTLERKSLYDAQELTQMIPLFGRDVYADLRKANPWTDRYLPNAQGAADEDHFVDPHLPRLKT